MRQPGVEVRRLKQITGSAEFCEVFFTNARVEKDHLVGRLNQGWQTTQTTFAFERGAETLIQVTRNTISLRRLIEAAKYLKVDGRSAWEDPLVRQKLGRAVVEIEVMRYGGLRSLSQLEKGGRPGPESSIAKLYFSEFSKRYHEWVLEILGPYGSLMSGMPEELNKTDPDGKVLDAFSAQACSVTIDPADNIYIGAECGIAQTLVYSPTHELIGSWSGPDMILAVPPQFGPNGEILALDRDGGIVKLKITLPPS